MRNLKRAFTALFMLLLSAVVLLFVLENQQSVPLVLFGRSFPEVPVAVLMISSLLLGLAVGPLLGAYGLMRSKRRAHSAVRAQSVS